MLYYARIEKFGMLTITSIIVAILLFIFGMGLTGAPICIAAGLIADLIAKSGNYKSKKKTILSYAVLVMLCFRCGLPQATSHLLLQLIPTRQVFLKAVMMNRSSAHYLRL